MDKLFGPARKLVINALKQPKVRGILIKAFAVFLILQIYFVRELIAAEALFLLGFVVVMTVVGICYALGTMGIKGLDLTEEGLRFAAHSARRSYDILEVIARNSVRHLPSERTK